jgi:hypothetical protein
MPRPDLELYPYRDSYRCPLVVRRAHRRFLRDHLGLIAPVSSCQVEASTVDDALRVRGWPSLPIDVSGLPAEVLAAVPGQMKPEELSGHTWRLFPRDPAVLWLPRVVVIRSAGGVYTAELQFAGRQPLPPRPLGFALQES